MVEETSSASHSKNVNSGSVDSQVANRDPLKDNVESADQNDLGDVSQRRLVERISGWRLNAFFCSVALNAALILAIAVVPLAPNPEWLELLVALVIGSHISFVLFVSGFRYTVATKLAIGCVYGVVCLWAIRNLESLGPLNFSGFRIYPFALVFLQTIVLTNGMAWLSSLYDLQVQKWYSIFDLLVLLSAFAILFPMVAAMFPYDAATSLEFFKPGGHWKRHAQPFAIYTSGHLMLTVVWSLLIVNFFLQPNTGRMHKLMSERPTQHRSTRSQRFFEELLVRLNSRPIIFALLSGVILYFVSRQFSVATARFSLYSATWVFVSLLPVCWMGVKRMD